MWIDEEDRQVPVSGKAPRIACNCLPDVKACLALPWGGLVRGPPARWARGSPRRRSREVWCVVNTYVSAIFLCVSPYCYLNMICSLSWFCRAPEHSHFPRPKLRGDYGKPLAENPSISQHAEHLHALLLPACHAGYKRWLVNYWCINS